MLSQGIDADLRIMSVKHLRVGELGHPLAIRSRCRAHRIVRDGFGKTTVPGRQHEAGAQTLDVPFPWTREGLVEVVDVENQDSFGRGEATEVCQVTIAARLNDD